MKFFFDFCFCVNLNYIEFGVIKKSPLFYFVSFIYANQKTYPYEKDNT